MRKYLIIGVVAAGLGLSACGSSAPATLDSAVSSVSSQPALEVHITASFSGPGMAKIQQYANDISLDVVEVNPSGGNLTQTSALDEDVTVNVGSGTLLEIRDISGNAYLKIDLSPLSSLPGVNLPASDIAGFNLLFGGRWFEVPASLIKSLAAKEQTSTAPSKKETREINTLRQAIIHIIETAHSTSVAGGGYTETATLASFVHALWPTIQSLGISQVAEPTDVKGSYTLTMTTSGSTLTGASASITAPDSSGSSNDTVAIKATISHNSASVATPAGATVVTQQLIQELENEAKASPLAA
ncbi:MAG: hypothetical protein WA359_08700 [Acidimicrobiales bacterium]